MPANTKARWKGLFDGEASPSYVAELGRLAELSAPACIQLLGTMASAQCLHACTRTLKAMTTASCSSSRPPTRRVWASF